MPDDTAPREATPDRLATAANPTDLRALHHLAFEHQDAAAFAQWRALDPQSQADALLDRHVFLSIISAASAQLAALGASSHARMHAYAERLQRTWMAVHESMRTRQQPVTVEWFQGLERWAETLLQQHLFASAEATLQLAYLTGSSRFAGIHQALRATEALLLATLGRTDEASQIALRYAMRPYLLPDRRLRPRIYRRLMAALILMGRVTEYRALLWRGLSDVYFDAADRAWFVQQARVTYRGTLRAVLHSDMPPALRLQFALQVAGDALGQLRLSRWLRLDRALQWGNFALAYSLQYGRAPRRALAPAAPAAVADRILVTRAMGGLGDLLMMTPGLRALRARHPATPIDFAIPRGFFPLLAGNPDVRLVDIESPDLDPAAYRLWFDLTDCPAARSDRVQIFAAAMGVGARALARRGHAPRYAVSAEEAAFARDYLARLHTDGRPLVGIQLRSAESYRDFPHNAALAAELARDCSVLLFDPLPIAGFDLPHVHKVVLPLRQSFAVAALCDVLVAPDSSFVHLGAALGKPVAAIFGPIDGAVRTRRFPSVKVVAPSPSDFPCSPCWRSEHTPCRLTGQRESACLRSIAPATVAATARVLAGAA
jgi:ADP-heptose:LPS heptosyltransferase